MIGFGGFITLPPAFAFLIMGKPIFTHEQNSVIGSANKVLSKFSKINFISESCIANNDIAIIIRTIPFELLSALILQLFQKKIIFNMKLFFKSKTLSMTIVIPD